MIVKDIFHFYTDEYNIHEDTFLNIMLQTFGLKGEKFHYIFVQMFRQLTLQKNWNGVCINCL